MRRREARTREVAIRVVQPGSTYIGSMGREVDALSGPVDKTELVVHGRVADRDKGRVDRGETGRRHIVRRGDKNAPIVIGDVGQFVQRSEVLVSGGAQAQVDQVHAVIDGPFQAGEEGFAAPRQLRSQHLKTTTKKVNNHGHHARSLDQRAISKR